MSSRAPLTWASVIGRSRRSTSAMTVGPGLLPDRLLRASRIRCARPPVAGWPSIQVLTPATRNGLATTTDCHPGAPATGPVCASSGSKAPRIACRASFNCAPVLRLEVACIVTVQIRSSHVMVYLRACSVRGGGRVEAAAGRAGRRRPARQHRGRRMALDRHHRGRSEAGQDQHGGGEQRRRPWRWRRVRPCRRRPGGRLAERQPG